MALAALIAGAAVPSTLSAFDIDVDELKDEIIAIEKAEAEVEAGDMEGGESPDEGVWKPFESEQGRFEILFPGFPEFKQSVRETAFGDIVENHYELINEEGDFSAEYNDLPLAIVLLASDRMILKRVKSALLEEIDGRGISFEKIKQGGLKGRELVFETADALGRSRFFIKKRRLYVLVATVQKDGGDEANVIKFLGSFEPFGKARGRKPHKYIEMLKPEPEGEEGPAPTPLPEGE